MIENKGREPTPKNTKAAAGPLYHMTLPMLRHWEAENVLKYFQSPKKGLGGSTYDLVVHELLKTCFQSGDGSSFVLQDGFDFCRGGPKQRPLLRA